MAAEPTRSRGSFSNLAKYFQGIGGRLFAAQVVIVAMAVVGLGLAISSFVVSST